MEAATGTRARTRAAIIDAAVAALSRDPAASLADIAAAAGVGRTTMHRYFPERSDLLKGIDLHALERIETATERARPAEGPAAQALDRLCQELFELGDVLILFTETTGVVDWDEETAADHALLALLARGQAEGVFDSTVSPAWLQHVLWSLLYGAWMHCRTDRISRHEALSLCLRTLAKVVAP